MDWTKSGRVDWFEFKKIDASKGVSGPESDIGGIVGGMLSWNYYSDTEVSGSLDAVKTPILNNCYVRVYLCSKLGSSTSRVMLATCYAHTSQGRYENGTYSGTIELVGTLARYTDDKLWKDWTLAKGDSAIDNLKKLFKYLGGSYKINGVKDRKLSSNKVVEFGESPYKVISTIASVCDAQAGADSYGRLVFEPYVVPSKRKVQGTIPNGDKSLMLAGVDIETTIYGTPNRAAVRYSYRKGKKDVVIYGLAAADKTSIVSAQKAGRYITETYMPSSMKPQTQAKANELAKTYLKKASGYTSSYTIKMLYYPVHIGEVWTVLYDNIKFDGMVASIDMDLVPGAPMTVTLRKVRSR